MRITEDIIDLLDKTISTCIKQEECIGEIARVLVNFENRIKALEEQQWQQKMAIEALHKGVKEIVGIEEESEDKNEQEEI